MKKISVISLVVILIDRILKILVENNLTLNIRNKVISNFFYLTYCKNEGAAFSILTGKTFFLILIGIVSLFLIYFLIKNKKNMTKFDIISYSLLIGGIIGNFVDRLIYGYVIDYLDFQFFGYRFAIFNFADMAIVIAAISLIIFSKGEDELWIK